MGSQRIKINVQEATKMKRKKSLSRSPSLNVNEPLSVCALRKLQVVTVAMILFTLTFARLHSMQHETNQWDTDPFCVCAWAKMRQNRASSVNAL